MSHPLPAPRPSLVGRALVLALGAAAGATILAAGPASASSEPPPVPGGRIGTLPHGKYTCELPGVAGGPVGHAQKDYEFTVVNGSFYRSAGVRGSYLLTGDMVQMTGGQLYGLRLHRISDTFLRRIEPDGSDGDLRCLLTTRSTA